MNTSFRARLMSISALVVVIPTLAALPLYAQPKSHGPSGPEPGMQLFRNGSRPSQPGPANWFTGSVRIDPVYSAGAPSRVGAASVTFEPGARTAWHLHPLGQILVVTAGAGWTQVEGEPKSDIRAGDVIWCPPDKRHWHGATSTTAMSHIAIQESKDGTPVIWMEMVTDAQYLAAVVAD